LIAVVGANHVGLKRMCRAVGFRNYNQVDANLYTGVFNASYTPSRLPHIPNAVPTINRTLMTNKLNALRMLEVSGLGEHVADYAEISQNAVEGDWIVKPYASQCGHGVRRYTGGHVPTGCYVQRDIQKFREFRAHVGLWRNFPCFTIQEKKPKPELWNEVTGGIDYHWPVSEDFVNDFPLTWNIESGFYFRRSTTPEDRADKCERFPLFRRIEELAAKAVKALGYQYGAVDILMNADRELFVVEINSHPAIINDNSKEIYKEVLEPLTHMSRERLVEIVGHGQSTGTQHHVFRRGHGFM